MWSCVSRSLQVIEKTRSVLGEAEEVELRRAAASWNRRGVERGASVEM